MGLSTDPVRVRLPQPTMREVFERMGFSFQRGMWNANAWAKGWPKEREVLTPRERKALNYGS